MNPGCVKPIHGFQVCVLGGVADADDGIGFDRFGQAQKLGQGGLSAKLRMDFLFAIASIIGLPPVRFLLLYLRILKR